MTASGLAMQFRAGLGAKEKTGGRGRKHDSTNETEGCVHTDLPVCLRPYTKPPGCTDRQANE